MKKAFICTISIFIITILFYTEGGVVVHAQTASTTGQASTTREERIKRELEKSERQYTLLEPLPCENLRANCTTEKVKFEQYVNIAFKLMFSLAIIIAIFRIVTGGFLYMTTDAVSGKHDGIEQIKTALWALLLIFGSYLILYFIDPKLVQIRKAIVEPLNLTATSTRALGELIDQLDRINELHDAREKADELQRLANELKAKAEDTDDPDEWVDLLSEARELEIKSATIRWGEAIKVRATDAQKAIDQLSVRTATQNGTYQTYATTNSRIDRSEFDKQMGGLIEDYNKAIRDFKNYGDVVSEQSYTAQKNYAVNALGDKASIAGIRILFERKERTKADAERELRAIEQSINNKKQTIGDPALQSKYDREVREAIGSVRRTINR
jgi:hypothetical protein